MRLAQAEDMAAKQIVDTLAAAKEAGVDPATALRLVAWD